MTATLTTEGGPLATPVHADSAGPSDPVWKDNAYLSFCDVTHQIFGAFHVSTSPNGSGARRSRCSVLIGGQGGRVVEIIDELEPGCSFEQGIVHRVH